MWLCRAIYVEHVHLLRTDARWQIVNTLWAPAAAQV
jgi:hypothetical protein